MRYLLGLDIGTSGTKTALFDEDGRTVASSTFGYELYQEKIGYAEQNPEDWFDACVNGIKNVITKSGVDPVDIKGVGLSGQMHGLVLLNERNEVIRKAIIWCDQRTEKECSYITSVIGKNRLIKITGNPATTGFTLSKLLWVRNNEPENYAKTRKILLPKDYIRFMLTGEFATEVSDASGMQMLDINKRDWSDELLSDLQINISLLPKVYESSVVSGYITKKAAELTGLKIGTPVVGGAGDQAAGAIGTGIVKEGVISTIIGTSGVVFASTNSPKFDSLGRIHTLCHAIPGKWHVMGVTQGAGLSLNWFKKNFCRQEIEESKSLNINVYDLLTKRANKSNPGSNGLIYLPYLMGERSPHLDPNIKGAFLGISLMNNHDDFIRSILEGVSFSLKNCLDIIESMGIKANDIRISGGGAESPVWRQILSDIYGKKLSLLKATEGPALGASILAGVGCGIYPSVEKACEKLIGTSGEKVNPNSNNRKIYEECYAKFNSGYGRVKSL